MELDSGKFIQALTDTLTKVIDECEDTKEFYKFLRGAPKRMQVQPSKLTIAALAEYTSANLLLCAYLNFRVRQPSISDLHSIQMYMKIELDSLSAESFHAIEELKKAEKNG